MARKNNPFKGADDIYLTKKNIAVRNVSQKFDKKGNYSYTDSTKYYPRTKANMTAATSVFGKIRSGRK